MPFYGLPLEPPLRRRKTSSANPANAAAPSSKLALVRSMSSLWHAAHTPGTTTTSLCCGYTRHQPHERHVSLIGEVGMGITESHWNGDTT